jgi:hypothetical protein
MTAALGRFAFKMDDPAFGRVPRAAARSSTRKRTTRAYYEYVEKSDADTAPASGYPEGIRLIANWYKSTTSHEVQWPQVESARAAMPRPRKAGRVA